jgi:hypothetical protein
MRNVKWRAGNTGAPRSFALTGQRAKLPYSEHPQFLGVFHVIEKDKHLPQLVHSTGGTPPALSSV